MTYEQAEKIAATIEHKCGGGSDYRVGAETLLEELDKAGAFTPARLTLDPPCCAYHGSMGGYHDGCVECEAVAGLT